MREGQLRFSDCMAYRLRYDKPLALPQGVIGTVRLLEHDDHAEEEAFQRGMEEGAAVLRDDFPAFTEESEKYFEETGLVRIDIFSCLFVRKFTRS